MKILTIKYILLFLLVHDLPANSQSQEIPIYFHSQYLLNNYLINPAVAGSVQFPVLSLASRQIIERIEGSPKTQILSIQSRLPNLGRVRQRGSPKAKFSNVGAGAFLYYDTNGPFRKTGFQVSYAYHVPMRSDFLSNLAFGISFTGFFYRIDQSLLQALQDPLITTLPVSSFIPDASFGIYYYGKSAFLGVSSAQLFETSIKLNHAIYLPISVNRSYFFQAGYKFRVSRFALLEPSVFFRADDSNLNSFYKQFDLNLNMYYSDFSLGLSIRNKESLIFMGKYRYENLFAGLAFGYPLGRLQRYHLVIAEVIIGYRFQKRNSLLSDPHGW